MVLWNALCPLGVRKSSIVSFSSLASLSFKKICFSKIQTRAILNFSLQGLNVISIFHVLSNKQPFIPQSSTFTFTPCMFYRFFHSLVTCIHPPIARVRETSSMAARLFGEYRWMPLFFLFFPSYSHSMRLHLTGYW